MLKQISSSKSGCQVEAKATIPCCVLVVGWSAPPYNGMSTATEIVLNGLLGEFQVVFLDIADKRDLSNVGKFEIGNILLALRSGIQFAYLLLKKKPRIVYVPIAQSWLPFLRDCLFLIPARLANCKVIIHLHGGHFGEFWAGSGRTMRAVIRFSLGKAARVIVLGECLRNLFDGVVPRNRVVAIPNGIPDFGNVRVSERQNAPTLLYLGALMRNKGVLELLSALPVVRETIHEVQLVLTGEWCSKGDYAAAMEIIIRNGIESCVRFTGTMGAPEKYELYRAADIFVMPSFNEGHPYAILEAMCAGLPVVGTDVGCIPETVIDGETGYIVSKYDAATLARRITTLLQDDELRVKMGAAARRRFEDFYTDCRFSEKLRAVFRELT